MLTGDMEDQKEVFDIVKNEWAQEINAATFTYRKPFHTTIYVS